jgi:uncharacterized lipoprotein YmbA
VSGRISRRFAIMTVALVSACSSSPPTRFYTLSEIAADMQPTPQSGTGSVRVYRVTIPGELDRPQVVRQIDANRLQIAEQDRWAAPLDEMIRRVLSGDLARRRPAPAAANANEAPPADQQRSLSVDIREFYGDPNCNVTLRAAWTLKQASAPARSTAPATATATPPATASPTPGSDTVTKEDRVTTEDIHVPSTGACPESLPATMSIALGQLSDHIVAGIGRL